MAIENLIDQLKSNLVQQMEVSGIRKYTLIRCGWMDCIWLLLLWLDMELNLIVRNGLMRLLNSSLSAISIHTIPRRDFIIMHGMRTGASAGLIRKLVHSPNFWGRSIGWWFMALVDALEYIPQDHSGYADMIKWTKELAETLSKYQDKNGLWYPGD